MAMARGELPYGSWPRERWRESRILALMVRNWVWLGLCLGLSSTALAESSVPQPRVSVPSEIPSGGVLPVFGNCFDAGCSNLKSVLVTDVSTETRVEGTFELVQTNTYEAWGYFVPSTPFRSGASYRVTTPNSYYGAASIVMVRDAETTALDESALNATAVLSKESLITDRRCCSSCIDVSVVNSLALTTTLATQESRATQYLFQLSMHAEGETGSVVAAFTPLLGSSIVSRTSAFDGAAKSYCSTVHAKPIVGGESFELLTRCLANDYTDLGTQTRPPEEVAKWAASCETSAPSRDAGAHRDAKAPTTELLDAAVDADGEPLGRGDGKTLGNDESGCQLASSASSAWWSLILLALARRRRAG